MQIRSDFRESEQKYTSREIGLAHYHTRKNREDTVTKGQVIELRKKWEQRVNRQPCLHRNQEAVHSEDGMVKETYHCLTCGKDVLRIYRETLTKPSH